MKKKAFSLVEMLVVLIVTSIILSALAPVITKKIKSSTISVGIATSSNNNSTADSNFKTECSAFSQNCSLCDENKCLSCSLNACKDGEYVDSVGCTCKTCSDKYGQSCLKCNSNECFKETTCVGDDVMIIGKLCVMKKNLGDSSNFPIKVAQVITAGSESCPSNRVTCCWRGTTGDTSSCSNNGVYSGCTRTACSWISGIYECAYATYGNLNWRLPTLAELKSFGPHIEELQMCDTKNHSTLSKCPNAPKCLGSYNNYCGINFVWSSELEDSTQAYMYVMADNSWYGPNTYSTTKGTMSVRCVADL